jgi:SAM-dependent methyltransferase
VLRGLGLRHGARSAPNASFESVVSNLARAGFVAPAPGSLDWGDLRRLVPLCPRFGFSRGTPIDRYYLDRFVERIRPEVTGDVVELGGRDSNRESYGLIGATRYRGLDQRARSSVSLAGDAHDSSILPERSLDAVLAFNVLEHCHSPWLVAENMGRWLRPGGKAFCMVPSAQRLHRMAEDYWRPLPAALPLLFTGFSATRLEVFGNPLTTLAALLGIAVEELSQRELDATHPDYPVASCIVATR